MSEPCPHCWGDTETIEFPQLTHPVIACLDCGAMNYTKPEDLENAEKIFDHGLFTSVNCYASPGTPNLGNGDRPESV